WPEAESLAMKDSLGREPRWNADRCAPGDPGAAGPVRHGRILNCVCRRFASDIFVRSFLSSLPDIAVRGTASFHSPMPAIHAELTLAQRFHRRSARVASAWTTRSKSGGDESESGVTVAFHSSDAQTHRENEILFFPPPARGERSDCGSNPGEGAWPRL